MVMKEHVCPYGMKSLWLLRHYGYDVDDNWLKTREETDAFREKHNVKTTPQTFIGGKRIGGYDQLRAFFNHPLPDKNKTSYKPVAVVFIMAALLAMAAQFASVGQIMTLRAAEWFVAFSMGMLALLKLRDVESFSTMFLGYDLLARQWVPYAWLYPFGEALAALLMTAGALPLVSAPVALFIGTVGAVSVVKAVYIDKRELRCACMGGDSNVPLGFISLTENLMMIAMGVWTLVKLFI
ncbi:MauE/DoxX family redox-associated membrane protein [Pantoea sp. EA-12]|uniref:MauE/DoxX family redox-associated membrane protein n=1 Tax=Pantoea sp. EA-12 TaxID=3043303 RepID=UPI0024B49A98|nr:MauE/DoxX family redox-associated membrane protein [Pantoea sp. EA-12]MDI9221605.1 MauE/DoxX family redox-associated membrane protein [Pantoea sp. EA-12]